MTEKTEKTDKTDKTKQAAMGLFDEAMRSYEQNIKTGLRLQEEAGKWWTNIFNQATSPQDWSRRVSRMAEDWIPATQKSMTESMKLIEENNRAGVDLLKKAVDAAQTTSLTESQAKWIDFWEASLRSMRSNAQVLTQMNGRAMDSWIDFMRVNSEPYRAGRNA